MPSSLLEDAIRGCPEKAIEVGLARLFYVVAGAAVLAVVALTDPSVEPARALA